MDEHGTEVWASDAWRERAVAWLDERLAAAGIERTGPVEQASLRPWATVLSAPTSGGTFWLKATGPDHAFEVRLYALLERVVPDHILRPLAIDQDRGWIVLPDGGTPLGEQARGEALVTALAEVLPRYGELQRALAPHAGELLALGVGDMRPEAMLGRFDEAVRAIEAYVERRGGPADRERVARVVALRGTYAGWCERLAAAPVGPSLDHNDLHPWNILAAGSAGRARFYDWGDAVVSHPFASMLLGLGFVALQVDGAPLEPLRDGYLEVFGDLATHAELVEALELACRVGKVARALTWQRAVGALGPEAVEDRWARAPLETMESLLDESYLGRT
jgi:hypothetical protein